MVKILKKLEPYRKRVDNAFNDLRPFSADHQLAEVMDYALFPGGKRLRPSITYLSAEVCGNEKPIIDPVACAVEFLHTASLILDDLPIMDNAPERRGLKSTHVVFGPHTAVLAAYSFVSLSFQVVSSSELSEHQIRLIVSELSRAIGPDGMSSGQMQNLRGITGARNSPSLEVAEKMTGSLFAASSYSGAVAADSPPELCNVLRDFGLSFGKAYQVLDDFRDAGHEDNPERSVNMVQVAGESRARELLKAELNQARRTLSRVGGHSLLEELVDSISMLANSQV